MSLTPTPSCFGSGGWGLGQDVAMWEFASIHWVPWWRALRGQGSDASGIPGGQWQMGTVGCVCVPMTKAQTSNTRYWSQTKANIEVDPLEKEE